MKQYADFNGRARRKELWMFVLFNMIAYIVLSVIDGLIFGANILSAIYCLAVMVPGIAVCVRRLHDIDKSGWWYFISYIPLIGGIWLLILCCQDGKPGTNEWGTNPKEIQ